MGVTRTFKYPTKDVKDEYNRLLKVLNTMTAQDLGSWIVNITVLHHKNIEDSCILCVIHHTNTQIAVLCSKRSREVIQGDKNLYKVIENTQCYKVRQQYTVTGTVYQLGDFVFRIGIGNMSNENKCLVLEIEFLGTRYISEATPSILEFMTLLDSSSHLKLIEIKYDQYFAMNSEESNLKTSAIDLLLCLNCISF
jgi:TATA-binding related factor (TRF) of subunit 20 of Mediator complex